MDPAAISANPAVTMMAVELTAPDSPAARANGTVSPSDIPMTISRMVSPAVKCCSTCGVWGIRFVTFCLSGYFPFLDSLSKRLVLSNLKMGRCLDALMHLSVASLCTLFDAQHALAHHYDIANILEQVIEDPGQRPNVVDTQASDQVCVTFILSVKSPEPRRFVFLCYPEHPVVRVKALDPHALLPIRD